MTTQEYGEQNNTKGSHNEKPQESELVKDNLQPRILVSSGMPYLARQCMTESIV